VPGEVRLSGLGTGRATVTRISEVAEREAPSLLQYLHERNLVPGTALVVTEVDPVGRNLRVVAAGRDLTLSQETAGKVWVLPD
jgi:hypothetical protein